MPPDSLDNRCTCVSPNRTLHFVSQILAVLLFSKKQIKVSFLFYLLADFIDCSLKWAATVLVLCGLLRLPQSWLFYRLSTHQYKAVCSSSLGKMIGW